MTDKVQPATAAQAAETTPVPKKTRARKAQAETAPATGEAEATETAAMPKKTRTRKAAATEDTAVEPAAAKKITKAASAKKAASGTKAKAKTKQADEVPEAVFGGGPVLDPIGGVIDGEAHIYTGDLATEELAELDVELEVEVDDEEEAERDEEAAFERPPARLERLQKILSQAGIASRRHAEEMIEQGRVMVNGQVVTTLGAKADPARDHIRVDGKLLQGAERHRYFVLNKPKGYVTTVSDPEGRPTVMEFFAKTGERLYPVGRLDYLSEGLLLMTNDGDLANLLTKAASGVEKTYLVKVAGQPSEEELDLLRGGVTIDRGQPGTGRVRTTAPARIRQIREGDNPWFEVVLIEGRNRELRKMFSAVGHFVEKIRRVGYGPLVLDVEPGKFRELDPSEVEVLRLTAEGKMKPRRMKVTAMLPKEAGKPTDVRKTQGRSGKPAFQPADHRPGGGTGGDRPFRSAEDRPQRSGFGSRPRPGQRRESGAGRSEFGNRSERQKPWRSGPNPAFNKPRRERTGGKPEFDRSQQERPGGRFRPNRPEGERGGERNEHFGGRTGGQRPFRSDRPRFEAKPRFERPTQQGRPGRGEGERHGDLHIEEVSHPSFRPRGNRPEFQRPDRPAKSFGKPGGRSFDRRPGKESDRGPGRGPDRELNKGPAKSWGSRPSDRPARPARTEGSAPAFRGKPAGKFGEAGRAKPAFGGKPKPDFGAKSKPGSSGGRSGGFSKPAGRGQGFKGKPGGPGRGNRFGRPKRG